MKFPAVYLLACCLSLSAAYGAPRETPAESVCSAATHAHRYSDMRFVDVEVSRVDDCGFSYVNLEEGTVGLDHYMRFGPDFILARVQEEGPNAEVLRTARFDKQKLRKGMRGVAVFCEACGVVLGLRLHGQKR